MMVVWLHRVIHRLALDTGWGIIINTKLFMSLNLLLPHTIQH